MTKEPRMPIGMSRFGFRASCAAVLTASKPMYAKNTTPAAPSIPRIPPYEWVMPCGVTYVTCAGMNGVWFRIYKVPPDSDHEQHDTHLQDNDKPVDECRFFRAANQE